VGLDKIQTSIENYLRKQDYRTLIITLALTYVLYHLLVAWYKILVLKVIRTIVDY